MFIYTRVVRVQDTDATGVIYFANVQKIALEAFEEFLRLQGFPLHLMVRDKEYLLPVVHAEADYKGAIHIGDVIEVKLELLHSGTSSFTLKSELFNVESQTSLAEVKIIHVVMLKTQMKSTSIPQDLLTILKNL